MKKIIYCCVLIGLLTKVQAQHVTITPAGITPVISHPRISYDAILALPSPQEGDLAYDTTFKCLRIYANGKWLCSYQNPNNYTPNLTPLVSIKGSLFDSTPSIAVDGSGNFYVVGMYSGSVTFGATTLTSSGHSDIFIAKYNKAGVVQWAQSAGGTAGEYGSDIAVDASGNIYITGGFSGTATFGTSSITSGGNNDVFIAGYTNNGVLLWVQQVGGAGDAMGTSIAIDESNNVYVTGNYANTATFGATSITSQSFTYDIFIAKYDSNGAFDWVQSAGGGGNESGSGIGIDNSGNVYVTGYFTGMATFGEIQKTSNGGGDIFFTKYDNNGNFQWVQTAGASDYDIGQNLAIDGDGNIYITGTFFGTITFGTTSIASQGGRDFFITKYDGNGNIIWVKSAGGTSTEGSVGIAVDDTGVYITGHYSSTVSFSSKIITPESYEYDILIAKYNKSTGNFIWVQTAGGTERDEGTDIAVDTTGNVYVVGNYRGTAKFGQTSKTAQADKDIFVVRLDQ
ncbi:SBBP repeat-containing protein [Emticicia sp. BO119]|uniref:SBBP repeat-containing protein n=1 Tax=Emticicia sp. BO119 TaxID=2757768 RepID=UPI0015F0F386|nr:SBBP repeat-containing protein [Emticicia sp. BO119]MBA4851473.1 SBBP repeat-containing protein [Emticicia sp. BO119]